MMTVLCHVAQLSLADKKNLGESANLLSCDSCMFITVIANGNINISIDS